MMSTTRITTDGATDGDAPGALRTVAAAGGGTADGCAVAQPGELAGAAAEQHDRNNRLLVTTR